jgi:hypothetical protein
MSITNVHTAINDIYVNATGVCGRCDYITTNYPTLKINYPLLCKMVCMPRFNIEKFNNIISKIMSNGYNVGSKRKYDALEEQDIESLESIHVMYLEQCCKHEYFV